MKLIVGLGNPGEKYQHNRHNVGQMVIDALASKIPNKAIVAKTDTFMNESGSFVKSLATSYKLPAANLYIIHDDLDLPLGSYKIQFGRGPKDHKGLESIDEALGTDQYWHVRIGIENRPERTGGPHFAKATRGEEYVLQNFTKVELAKLSKVQEQLLTSLLRRFHR